MIESNRRAVRKSGDSPASYRFGVLIAGIASLLTIWTTIVRDDGNGAGYFMIILAVAVGWLAAAFRPSGMMRAMVGVAGMQIALGALIATAPVTANSPGQPLMAVLSSAAFAALWLTSAACFRADARRSAEDHASGPSA